MRSFVKFDRTVETIEITTAARIADRAESTIMPVTTWEASHNTIAFITKVKSPKVRRLIGKVMNTKNGLIKILISPITTAAKRAVVKSATRKPGTM